MEIVDESNAFQLKNVMFEETKNIMHLYLAVVGLLSEEYPVVNEITEAKTSRGFGRGSGGTVLVVEEATI